MAATNNFSKASCNSVYIPQKASEKPPIAPICLSNNCLQLPYTLEKQLNTIAREFGEIWKYSNLLPYNTTIYILILADK
jgi:hypothetical protein